MKALLMHRDCDFDMKAKLPRNESQLIQDLELDTLLQAMAAEDPFLLDVSKKALLTGLGNDIGTILYRQQIVKDCLANPEIVRTLYGRFSRKGSRTSSPCSKQSSATTTSPASPPI